MGAGLRLKGRDVIVATVSAIFGPKVAAVLATVVGSLCGG
jgi:uncharacterized membrane protein